MKFKNLQKIEYSIYFLKPRWNGKSFHGLCDNPKTPKPQILIDPSLKDRRRLNVLIEEMFHAHFFHLSEKEARKFSANLGKIIYKLFLAKKKTKKS